MTKLHSFVYRATDGRMGGGRIAGGPVLLLNTTGRKSGKERIVPLLYLRDDEVLVASNGGAPEHPAWWLNLREPRGHRRDRAPQAAGAGGKGAPEEKERLWPRLVAMYGGYESYRRRTDREIPVAVLHPIEKMPNRIERKGAQIVLWSLG